jgi:hypothetical protein
LSVTKEIFQKKKTMKPAWMRIENFHHTEVNLLR